MGLIQQTIMYHSDNNFISEYRHANPTLGSGNYSSRYSQHFFGKHTVDDAGFIYVTGRSGRYGGSYYPPDATTRSISKLTPMGQVIFTKDLDDLDVYFNQLYSADNHIYGIGYRKFVVNSNGDDKGDDALLIKFTNDLDIVWFRMLGNNDNFNFFEEFTGLAVDSSNNVYVSGEGQGGYSASVAVVKYNSSGTQQWKKLINYYSGDMNTSESFYADYIHIDSSNNLYLAGRTSNANGGNKNNGTPFCNGYFIRSCHVKLNSSGSVLWKKSRRARWTVSGTGSYAGCYHHYAAGHVTGGIDSNGNIYSAQNHRSLSNIPSYNSYRSDAFSLIKRNSSGTLQWEKNFYATNTSNTAFSTGTAQELQFDNDDNIYLATSSNFSNGSSSNGDYYPESIIILKFNSSGTLLWARKIHRNNIANGETYAPKATAFKLDKNRESFTISGSFRDNNALAGTQQGFILKLPIDGSKTGTYDHWIYEAYNGLTFSDNHPNSNVDISGVEYSTSNITSNSNNMEDRSSVSANNTTITTGANPAANYLENIP